MKTKGFIWLTRKDKTSWICMPTINTLKNYYYYYDDDKGSRQFLFLESYDGRIVHIITHIVISFYQPS